MKKLLSCLLAFMIVQAFGCAFFNQKDLKPSAMNQTPSIDEQDQIDGDRMAY